jgi:hypothetical protein
MNLPTIPPPSLLHEKVWAVHWHPLPSSTPYTVAATMTHPEAEQFAARLHRTAADRSWRGWAEVVLTL